VGCILYEMMTGRVPFKAQTAVQILMMHVHQPPERPSAMGVSPEMERIILKAMAKNPAERYQTAAEFLEALAAREQQLIAAGHKANALRLPGQDATVAMVMPDDVKALAKAAMNTPGQRPPTAGQATAALPQIPAAGGASRTTLLIIASLLVILLVIVVVLIAVIKMK
jgi:hypothetical protein